MLSCNREKVINLTVRHPLMFLNNFLILNPMNIAMAWRGMKIRSLVEP